jgi:hypothetical protein
MKVAERKIGTIATEEEKQNLTIRLSKRTIQKARVLAAKRSTSISGLVASQIEQMVEGEDEYDRTMQSAIARMKKGFNLGGTHKLDRDALHDRSPLRK